MLQNQLAKSFDELEGIPMERLSGTHSQCGAEKNFCYTPIEVDWDKAANTVTFKTQFKIDKTDNSGIVKRQYGYQIFKDDKSIEPLEEAKSEWVAY